MDAQDCQSFVSLLNAQSEWTTDESMLGVVPSKAREFSSQSEWPRLKALAYLHNNAVALRAAFDALERGEALDLDLLNPVLESIRLKASFATDGSGRGTLTAPVSLAPVLVTDRMNLGTAWIRWTVQRAAYDFVRYAGWRRTDPVYPAATPFRIRVVACVRPSCHRLAASGTGQTIPCAACAGTEDRR